MYTHDPDALLHNSLSLLRLENSSFVAYFDYSTVFERKRFALHAHARFICVIGRLMVTTQVA